MSNKKQQQQQKKKSSILKLAGWAIGAIFVGGAGHKGVEAKQRKNAMNASMKENNRD